MTARNMQHMHFTFQKLCNKDEFYDFFVAEVIYDEGAATEFIVISIATLASKQYPWICIRISFSMHCWCCFVDRFRTLKQLQAVVIFVSDLGGDAAHV